MLERAIADYYTFFDETLHSGTLLVLMIVSIIFAIGTIMPLANADVSYMKGNALEAIKVQNSLNTVIIDGQKYEIIFSKIDE